MTFKLSEKGKKTKIRIEKQKVTCSVALVTAFFGNENRQLKDLSQVIKRCYLFIKAKWSTL